MRMMKCLVCLVTVTSILSMACERRQKGGNEKTRPNMPIGKKEAPLSAPENETGNSPDRSPLTVLSDSLPPFTPCPHFPALHCFALSMPLDHAASEGQSKSKLVTFAMRPADDPAAQEALLVLFGGPGDPGVFGLGRWLDRIDPRLKQRFTIVTMDLRGVQGSGQMDCQAASRVFSFTPPWVYSQEEIASLATAAEKAAQDCVSELGQAPDELLFYNSKEAAADLESFRKLLGIETWNVYALSYGTQLAQTYAQRFPGHTRALVLDGAVDLNADLLTYERELTLAQNQIFADLDRACREMPACKAAFQSVAKKGGFFAPTAVYDLLFAQLLENNVSMALPSTQDAAITESIEMSANDLEYALSGSITYPAGRARFLWALSRAWRDGDFTPLYRIADGRMEPAFASASELVARPAVMKELPYSSAGVFWTFICNDYGAPEGADAWSRFDGFVQQALPLQAEGLRLHGPLFSESVCAYWPGVKGPQARPPLFTGTGIPTLVIGATADGNVPFVQAQRIAARLDKGSLIRVTGSQHVSYSYHISCVNEVVNQLFLEKVLPDAREVTCTDIFLGPWPLAKVSQESKP